MPSSEEIGNATFGPFKFDLRTRELFREDVRLSLEEKPALLLRHLILASGGMVTREELRQVLWPRGIHLDREHGLNKAINKIRLVLGDNPQEPRYLETLPRRGYRFIATVELIADVAVLHPQPKSQAEQPLAVGPEASTILATEEEKKRHWLMPAAVTALVIAALIGGLYYRSHGAKPLTEKDTIVVADFDNRTGDAVFDETLKTALTVALNQSPFLNVLPDNRVAATLKLMTRQASTKLTPDIARELCVRAGSKAYVAGSIASLGSEYVLELKMVACQNDDTLAQVQVTANGKEKVLNALGNAAAKLRRQLGESLASVQKFDVPLQEATTSSLDALQAYSRGRKEFAERGPAAALLYDQRAIELDSNFAMAYWALGWDCLSLGEMGQANEYQTKAWQLRDRASERERLSIAAVYYQLVRGERDKAVQIYQQLIDTYPRDGTAYDNLGMAYAALGSYSKAWEVAQRGRSVEPDSVRVYENLANYGLALQRFDDTKRIINEATERKLDDSGLRNAVYCLGFLEENRAIMAAQQAWYIDHAEVADQSLALAADTEAYEGRLKQARLLSKKAVDSAIRADNKENAGVWWENAALREAAFGNLAEARVAAAAGLDLAPTRKGVELEGALAYAMAGDFIKADSLAKRLNQRYPMDNQVQALWLPAIQAQTALNRKTPSRAISQLERTVPPIEYGIIAFLAQTSCLYPTYIRGQAYLAAGQGKEAAAEFQKILDHSGIVWNCWTGALARLGVARAHAMQGDKATAKAKYQDFLALWKDADPNIPIYQQAKAEYARISRQ